MAGSYNHATTKKGKLRNIDGFNGMLENMGDIYEFAEEAYGMIWYLAEALSSEGVNMTPADFVEDARKNYEEGLKSSPGIQKD